MSDKVIVGIEHHKFQGQQLLCSGFLGGHSNSQCREPRDHPVHSLPPGWTSWGDVSDTGQRTSYSNGMMREVNPDKPAFDLLLPRGVRYEDQLITRFAVQMTKGAKKYAPRNWELGIGIDEYERAKASAFRHMMQWLTDENDEDHAAAVLFNIMQAEYIRIKLEKNET